ncbi:hypothetical protein AGLY_010759 [Aphis glycines]|uniref:Uncharacterized protein n=1 Tax=Aphis glycines TaxID=307491 RepID=A0A6G0TGP7_APHGL|nr:hypothetical protein AGLY_010759 [Aphis glycines]
MQKVNTIRKNYVVDATLGMFFKHNNFILSGRLRDGKANVGILFNCENCISSKHRRIIIALKIHILYYLTFSLFFFFHIFIKALYNTDILTFIIITSELLEKKKKHLTLELQIHFLNPINILLTIWKIIYSFGKRLKIFVLKTRRSVYTLLDVYNLPNTQAKHLVVYTTMLLLHFSYLTDQQILRLNISVKYTTLILTTYSKTNVSVSRVCTMSCKVTTLLCFSSFNNEASRIAVKGAPSSSCNKQQIHTPNAEYRLVRLWLGWFRNTSDLGLGGFLGLRMTRVSSQIASSNSFESDDTDNCRLTRSWSPRPELQSKIQI